METLAILRDCHVEIVDDVIYWASWMKESNTRVAISNREDATISTVFIGINHGFADQLQSLWFETLVIGGELDGFRVQYETLEEAMQGHEFIVWLIDPVYFIRRYEGVEE